MSDERSPLHHEFWAMIPWVLNGTADAAQCRRFELHALGCADCREELAFQRLLQTGMRAESVPPHAAEPALQRLLARLDQAREWPQAESPQAAPPPAVSGVRWPDRRWLVAAVCLQAVGLTALGTMWWQRPGAAAYETLSRAEVSSARIRLVPAPQLSLAELQALLSRAQLSIVETDGSASLLGLAPAPGARLTLAQSLAQLRAEPGVRLAEPLP